MMKKALLHLLLLSQPLLFIGVMRNPRPVLSNQNSRNLAIWWACGRPNQTTGCGGAWLYGNIWTLDNTYLQWNTVMRIPSKESVKFYTAFITYSIKSQQFVTTSFFSG